MPTDPVCGKDIAEDDATALSSYDGVTYYFCSLACSREFDLKVGDYYGGPPPEMT